MPQSTNTANSLLLLDNQLCFALYSASLAMTKLYKSLLQELNLTYPQFLAMLVLWETDGMTVSALGARLYLDSGTLTPLLKRIESAGLIARIRSVDDQRHVHINLTAAGRRLKSRAAKVPACVLSASGCTLDELQSLTQQLQSVRQRLTA